MSYRLEYELEQMHRDYGGVFHPTTEEQVYVLFLWAVWARQYPGDFATMTLPA